MDDLAYCVDLINGFYAEAIMYPEEALAILQVSITAENLLPTAFVAGHLTIRNLNQLLNEDLRDSAVRVCVASYERLTFLGLEHIGRTVWYDDSIALRFLYG